MNQFFHQFFDKFVVVFIDDILIYSKSPKEHSNHLRIIFQILKERKLFAMLLKYEFWLSQVQFLGNIVSSEGIRVDPSKVEVVTRWERPTTPTKICSFLGLAGYYRKFIKGFSCLTLPLTKLTRNEQDFKWNDDCEASFKELKRRLTFAPVLILPNLEKKFKFYCDALGQRLCYVFMQEQKFLAYASRHLRPHEVNNPTHDLELAAIVCALKIWRHYLYKTRFYVFSDHKSLKYLFD